MINFKISSNGFALNCVRNADNDKESENLSSQVHCNPS